MDEKYLRDEIRNMPSDELCKQLRAMARGREFTTTEQYATEAARRIAAFKDEKELLQQKLTAARKLETEASAARAEALEEVMVDFQKCGDVAQGLSSMYPDLPGIWAGTVSARICKGVLRMKDEIAELRAENERLRAK